MRKIILILVVIFLLITNCYAYYTQQDFEQLIGKNITIILSTELPKLFITEDIKVIEIINCSQETYLIIRYLNCVDIVLDIINIKDIIVIEELK